MYSCHVSPSCTHHAQECFQNTPFVQSYPVWYLNIAYISSKCIKLLLAQNEIGFWSLKFNEVIRYIVINQHQFTFVSHLSASYNNKYRFGSVYSLLQRKHQSVSRSCFVSPQLKVDINWQQNESEDIVRNEVYIK